MFLQLLPAVGAAAFILTGSQDVGVLALLCLISLACSVLYVFRRCGIISFAALFVLCYAALYLLYPSTALLLDLYVPQDERVSEYAFLTVFGLSLFIVAHAITARQKVSLRFPSLRADRVNLAFWVCIVPLVGACLLIATNWPSFSDLLNATRVDIKEGVSGSSLASAYLWVAGSVGISLGPLYLRDKPLGWIPFAAFVCLAAAGGFLAFRTRSVLVLVVNSLLLGLWLKREVHVVRDMAHAPRRSRLRSPAFWRLIVLGAIAVVAVSYVRIARGLFEEQGVAGLAQVDLGAAILYNMERGDLAYAPVVFDVLEHVPEQAAYLRGQSYYRLAFVPIPRAVWPDKPLNTERVVASWLYPGKRQQTTPPGIQGDLYINFGLAGVVGFAGFGWLIGLLDRRRGLGRALAVGGGIIPVVHLVRGGFTNPLLLLVALVATASIGAAIAEGRLRFAGRSP